MVAVQRLLREFFGLRLGRTLGFGLFALSLLAYRSYADRTVLGRWSVEFALLLAASGLVFVVLAFDSWRRMRRPTGDRLATAAGRWLDLSVLAWGAAHLLSALRRPESAGRVTDLNVVGSNVPAAAILEWLAFVSALAGVTTIWFARVSGPRRRYGLPVLAALATLLAGEGFFRARVAVAPFTYSSPAYANDVWMATHVRYNRLGFRDREHETAKPSGTSRLLVVGDSFAFGFGIERPGDRFGERLAEALAERTGERWESINASREDTHTLQHIAFLEQALPLQPDVVVLLYVFNDIDYLYPITPRNRYSLIHPRSLLLRNSYLFQDLFARLRLFRHRFRGPAVQVRVYDDCEKLQIHLRDLARFVDLARQAGAIVGVAPIDPQVTLSVDYRRRYDGFADCAEAAGLPIWRVGREAFGERAFGELVVSRVDPHPNASAYEMAARAVLDRAAGITGRRSVIVGSPGQPGVDPRAPRSD